MRILLSSNQKLTSFIQGSLPMLMTMVCQTTTWKPGPCWKDQWGATASLPFSHRILLQGNIPRSHSMKNSILGPFFRIHIQVGIWKYGPVSLPARGGIPQDILSMPGRIAGAEVSPDGCTFVCSINGEKSGVWIMGNSDSGQGSTPECRYLFSSPKTRPSFTFTSN